MDALIDVLIYLFFIGGAALIIGVLSYGIYCMFCKIRRVDADKLRIQSNRKYIRERMGRCG